MVKNGVPGLKLLQSGLMRGRIVLRDRPFDVIALGVLGIVLVLVMTTAMRSPLKDDVAWLLYVARKWLAGQRLYEDLIEVNPPLIIWIYALPSLLAGWLHVAPKLIAVPFFAALVLAASWCSAVLLRGRGPLFGNPVPVFVVIGIIMLVLPGVEFGQREHLMTACILPFLCVMARWLDGEQVPRGVSLAVGIVAGLGCALKPTYALAFVLPEVVGLLAGRRVVRTASLAAALAVLAYVLAVLLVCPAFFTRAVPLALALYGGTDMPPLDLLIEARVLIFGVGVAFLLWLVSRRQLAQRSGFTASLYVILLAFAAGASVVYVLQGKDWFYHRLPAITVTMLALALWGAEILPRFALPMRRMIPTAGLALVAFGLFAQANIERMRPWVEEAVEPDLSTETRLVKILKKEKARTYIAFSEWIGLGFPVVDETGVVWASRFDSMWALKGELWRASKDGRAPREWPIRKWIARDFVAGCPDIAVVDTREGINYISVLVNGDPAFAAAWTHYAEIARFNGLRVLKREGPSCTAARPAQWASQVSDTP
jgi:hypothetical protein